MRILLAEENEELIVTLQRALQTEGYSVDPMYPSQALADRVASRLPDALVFGCPAPGSAAISLCRTLRTNPATARVPVVVLLDSSFEMDRLAVLSAGADDCLMKNVSPVELLIRLKNLLRRLNPALLDTTLKVGDIVLDKNARRVHRQKKEIKLGPTEFRLLEFLMKTPGRVYSRTELRTSLWGDDASVDERAVDVHIGRLRRGISLGKTDKVIRTVRGAGYALSDF
ncbi:winged helix-turn-helix domain-containing protein [Rhizobium laguerreae]|uniref:winged helix-turn-helix domain-containing protein n=1 Tax=Rhizobium laguerreae TaxID=1076926 RepID=UPI0028A7416E|nr:winged helix-turn-helix domain-containing protein [Rhizobium laguerreae]